MCVRVCMCGSYNHLLTHRCTDASSEPSIEETREFFERLLRKRPGISSSTKQAKPERVNQNRDEKALSEFFDGLLRQPVFSSSEIQVEPECVNENIEKALSEFFDRLLKRPNVSSSDRQDEPASKRMKKTPVKQDV